MIHISCLRLARLGLLLIIGGIAKPTGALAQNRPPMVPPAEVTVGTAGASVPPPAGFGAGIPSALGAIPGLMPACGFAPPGGPPREEIFRVQVSATNVNITQPLAADAAMWQAAIDANLPGGCAGLGGTLSFQNHGALANNQGSWTVWADALCCS